MNNIKIKDVTFRPLFWSFQERAEDSIYFLVPRNTYKNGSNNGAYSYAVIPSEFAAVIHYYCDYGRPAQDMFCEILQNYQMVKIVVDMLDEDEVRVNPLPFTLYQAADYIYTSLYELRVKE